MNTKYKDLVGGAMDALELASASTKREIFGQMVEDLEGGPEENKRGVAALINYEKIEGKEPAEPGAAPDAPEKSLSLGTREGEINPTEIAKSLYATATGKDFPGTGKASEQEMQNQDAWEGFRAAGYQSGKDTPGMLQDGQEKGKESPAQDETWGPSRMIKGMRTMDAKEFLKGIQECEGIGMEKQACDSIKELFPQKQVEKMLDKMVGLGDGKDGKMGVDLLGSTDKQTASNMFDNMTKVAEGSTEGMRWLTEKNKEIAALGPNADPKAVLGCLMGKEEKKPEAPSKTPPPLPDQEESTLDTVAGKMAGAVAYKKSRQQGLPSSMAGVAAETAKDAMSEIGKGFNQDGKEDIKKAVEMAKVGKNLLVAGSSKALTAIPGVGQVLAVGLQVANMAANFAIDFAMANTGVKPLPGQEEEKKDADGKEAPPAPGQAPATGKDDPEPGVAKQAIRPAMKGAKGKIAAKFLPGGEFAEKGIEAAGELGGKGGEAMKGMVSELDKDKTKKPQDELMEVTR